MPLITAQRGGPCAACGGTIRQGEQAWYTREGGLRHPEAHCRTSAQARFRPNQRAGTCKCGAHVPASAGRLMYLPNEGRRSCWVVRCLACPA